MKIFAYILVVLIFLVGSTFAILNSELVSINYYFGVQHLPLSLLLLMALVVGVVLGLLANFFVLLRAKHQARQLMKRLNLAQKEVENLRVAPIHD